MYRGPTNVDCHFIQHPRPLAEIKADILALEKSSLELKKIVLED